MLIQAFETLERNEEAFDANCCDYVSLLKTWRASIAFAQVVEAMGEEEFDRRVQECG